MFFCETCISHAYCVNLAGCKHDCTARFPLVPVQDEKHEIGADPSVIQGFLCHTSPTENQASGFNVVVEWCIFLTHF